MSIVTDADRVRAAVIVGSMSDEVLGRLLEQDIAAALAEERARARAPFLALADRWKDPPGLRTPKGVFARALLSAAEDAEREEARAPFLALAEEMHESGDCGEQDCNGGAYGNGLPS